MKKLLRTTFLLFIILKLSSCVPVTIEATGVFKKPYKYKRYKDGLISPMISTVEIDGEKVSFRYLGECGAKLASLGIILPIPIIPGYYDTNDCKKEGFWILSHHTSNINFKNVNFQ